MKTLYIGNNYAVRQCLPSLTWPSNVEDAGAKELAGALEYNSTLTSLTLDATNIGTQGAQSLAHALQINSSLQVLCLPMNPIPGEGIQALAAALGNNNTLLKLDIDNSCFSSIANPEMFNEASIQALATALQNNTMLKELVLPDCAKNGLALQLADALQANTTLIKLRCELYNIGDLPRRRDMIPENIQRADAVLGPLLQRNRNFIPGKEYPGIGFWSGAPRVNEPLRLEAAPVPHAAGAVPNPQPPTTGQEESPEVVGAPTP